MNSKKIKKDKDIKFQEFRKKLLPDSDPYEIQLTEKMLIQSTLVSKEDLDYCNLVKNMTHFYDIFGGKDWDKKKVLESYDLKKVIEHYLRDKKKKKIYLKIDNLYIVGKYFTEGIQYIPEGEEHHFEILGIRPVDIFNLKSSKELPINSLDTNFIKVDECLRAESGKKYAVYSGYYLIMTPYKACFKKTIVKSSEVPSPSSDGDQLERENDTAREGTEESQNLLESSDFSLHRPSMHLEESNGGLDSEENVRDNNQKRFSEEPEGHPKRRKSNVQHSENLIVKRDNGTSSNMDLMKMNQVNGQFQSISVEVAVNDQSFIANGNASVFGIRKSGCIESYSLDPDSTFEILPDGSLIGKFSIRNQDMDPYIICYDCEGRIITERAIFKNGSVWESP
ncbi:uncharacterized protein TNIN_379491 [Trichonephila inaurata madagascariensis]|uniref:Uncharacterized protein n=1 Tax=Trichonephila inaurata madagascariensis TaxID=2747483 RepID=A0A8X6WQG1_9ARAC|nr:uncharacterized protein TNIN_379491 [Trichonephila inaurata madagascariensis]